VTSDSRRDPFDEFAAREPYFTVLTAPRFLRANLTPESEREFFASGEALVDWMFDVIEAGLSPRFAPIATLEYGCGVGRLALPLARRPGAVTAVDRSPAMLAQARREADRAGLSHIVFESPDALFASPRKFDLVLCYHVLQRLRPRDGLALLSRLIDLIGPNGVGVFQCPYRRDSSRGVRDRVVDASRWVREALPAANTLANRLRGRADAEPFIPTHLYDLDDLLPAFDAAGFRATHVVFEQQQDLGYTIVFAQKPERRHAAIWSPDRTALERDARSSAAPAATDASDAEIDRDNRTAELYFATLKDWDHHLAKPFSQVAEAPAILINVAILLQGLDLGPGTRVLDFGAGSGWLSRFLTQLGCEMTLLDVSPTALEIARELFRRVPVVGERPAPAFLTFDGRRIPVADGALDRIVCCDAFHHAPNPDAMIREFARVLAPGGIAGFAEPGPRHSESARSQFESQTYGVVERDVDVHAIWRTARQCGFADLRMAVFHEPPYFVPLGEYEDLIAGGVAQERWQASVRGFLHHTRTFFLTKAGAPPADSRRTAGLACEIDAAVASGPLVAGTPIVVEAGVRNTGRAIWIPSGDAHGAVSLGAHLYDAAGELIEFEAARSPLTDPPRPIAPGEHVSVRLSLGPLAAGRYRLEIDLVAANVAWFAQAGSTPVVLMLDVT
jgi:SAM-dependent methyltransferase